MMQAELDKGGLFSASVIKFVGLLR